MDRNEMLSKRLGIEGTHLFREIINSGGRTYVNFYKFGSDRIIGPFSCSDYYYMGGEEYDKIVYLINHGTEKEIEEYDRGLVELVRAGCGPGTPFIVLDGEGYVMVENVFNRPEANVEVRGWQELEDDELIHWCDIVNELEEEMAIK